MKDFKLVSVSRVRAARIIVASTCPDHPILREIQPHLAMADSDQRPFVTVPKELCKRLDSLARDILQPNRKAASKLEVAVVCFGIVLAILTVSIWVIIAFFAIAVFVLERFARRGGLEVKLLSAARNKTHSVSHLLPDKELVEGAGEINSIGGGDEVDR